MFGRAAAGRLVACDNNQTIDVTASPMPSPLAQVYYSCVSFRLCFVSSLCFPVFSARSSGWATMLFIYEPLLLKYFEALMEGMIPIEVSLFSRSWQENLEQWNEEQNNRSRRSWCQTHLCLCICSFFFPFTLSHALITLALGLYRESGRSFPLSSYTNPRRVVARRRSVLVESKGRRELSQNLAWNFFSRIRFTSC